MLHVATAAAAAHFQSICVLSNAGVIDRSAAFKSVITVITQKHFSVANEDKFECSTGILIRLMHRIENLCEKKESVKLRMREGRRWGGIPFI